MADPPISPVAAPPLKEVEPDRPVAALPVDILISPLLPDVLAPDTKDN